LLPQVPWPTT